MQALQCCRGSRGQGLIEYLIVVALMACASIGIVKVLNGTVQAHFAGVVHKLQNSRGQEPQGPRMRPADYAKKDLGNFMKPDGGEGGGDGFFQ
jgi:pilus assembly protein Flp/PilA